MKTKKRSFPLNIYDMLPPVGRYAELAAKWVDDIHFRPTRSRFGRVWKFISQRLVANTIFPLLAVFDMASAIVLAGVNFLGVVFTSDAKQQKYINNLQEYATLFSKSLWALVATVIGLGLYDPKLSTLTFIPEKEQNGTVRSAGKHLADTVTRLTPSNTEKLAEIIRKAKDGGYSVMAVGAGFSQGRQYLPRTEEGVSVDLRHFNKVEINSDERVVTVGAGATWADIQMEANKFGLALKVMQASNVFSVGGSIGTNIHGWDHNNGILANVIKELTYLDANGLMHKVMRNSEGGFTHVYYNAAGAEARREESADDKAFNHIIGGFGQFGIVVEAKIELTENEYLHEVGRKVDPSAYVEHFRKKIQNNPNVAMTLYRLSLDPDNLLAEGVSVTYERGEDHATKVVTPDLQQEGVRGTRFSRILANLARHFPWLRRWYWNGERDRLLSKETHRTVLTTNDIMKPEIKAMFNEANSEAEWLQEFFIPPEDLDAFLKDLARILKTNDVALLNATVRYVPQYKDNPLSYSYNGERFAVVLCFNQPLLEADKRKAKIWIREAQARAVKNGGSFYLPYQNLAKREDVEKSYPKIGDFRKAKYELDPKGVFTSGMYENLMKKKTPEHNHYRRIMSNPDLREQFKGFIDNVFMQVDTKDFYDLLDDVLKYCDSKDDIYRELQARLHEIDYGTLTKMRQILRSLSHIKTELTEQVASTIDMDREYDGYVEIGYPARFARSFKAKLPLKGRVWAVHEEESYSDYLQSGFPSPTDEFVPLSYDKPELEGIPSKSTSIVSCFVGLHHFTPEALHEFLTQVRRILKDDGVFLLVDHDARDQDEFDMATMAHSVFNAVTGVSAEDEVSEVRNFKPMTEWLKILASYGIVAADSSPDVEMIRDGDPSRNKMMAFKAGPKPQLDISQIIPPFGVPFFSTLTWQQRLKQIAKQKITAVPSVNASTISSIISGGATTPWSSGGVYTSPPLSLSSQVPLALRHYPGLFFGGLQSRSNPIVGVSSASDVLPTDVAGRESHDGVTRLFNS